MDTTNNSNNGTTSTSSLQDLVKILPMKEKILQISMGNQPNANLDDSNDNTVYHTLRYDFKPASVDGDEPAKLELTKNGQVTLVAPNVPGSVSTHTVFRGQRRPHVKECLLVIDHQTGQIVLQKLNDNVTVKATRGMNSSGPPQNQTQPQPQQTHAPAPTPVVNNNDNNFIVNNNAVVNNVNSIGNGNSTQTTNPTNNGPQLSEDSDSDSDSDSSEDDGSDSGSDSGSSSSSSGTSSSSSSQSGGSSPNDGGFSF